MPKLIEMPKLGVNMTDAVITEWLVKEGETVQAGQTILLAETDKAVQEIPATQSGVVLRLLAGESETVEVLRPILVVGEPGEICTEEELDALIAVPQKSEFPGTAPEKTVPTPVTTSASVAQEMRVKITPLARKTAARLGFDFREIPPSLRTGRIANRDVLAYAERNQARGHAQAPVKLAGARGLIAARMTESVNTKPSVPLTLTVDADALLKWRQESRAKGSGVGLNAMLIAAAAHALREFPVMNARITDAIELQDRINIGLAVDTEGGLLVPKVFDADQKSPVQIQRELDALVERARVGRIDVRELNGGTFTITNLGMFEIEQFDAILNPPEVGILAVGAIREEPIVKGGVVLPGRVMRLTLSFDHRATDGGPAARFLQRLKHLLECPVSLFC